MALHQRYNNENILIRAIIAGLLNILNNKISYEQVWSNEDIETINIPWFYNMSGDERFMQDFYTHYAHCIPPKPVDGNFDMIPRGVITYTGSRIDPGRITSRYVQGTYLKEIDGQLQTMRSFLYQIPLNISIDCEMWFDTQITSLKVEQVIRETFYKTITFYVYYRGMRVGCTVGFPEDYTLAKSIEYSFETDNKIKLNFSLEIESYQPVFDPTTEVNANDYISGIGLNIVDKNVADNKGIIRISNETDFSNSIIPKGYPYLFEWTYTNENAIINKVDILWSETGTLNKHVIEKGVPNNEFYVWNIPESFTDYNHPTIIWNETDDVKIYREPLIRILPDLATNEITPESFYIIDEGYFISANPDASISATLEMKNSNNNIVYSEDDALHFVLTGNKINSDRAYITDTVQMPAGPIVFPGDIYSKTIDIYVINSTISYEHQRMDKNDLGDFGIIKNVTVV